MPRTTKRRDRLGRLRSKAAFLAAGIGASMALGTGVAANASDSAPQSDVFAAGAAADLARAARAQAEEQDRAVLDMKSAAAREKAQKRAQEAKQKASRAASRAAQRHRAHVWGKPVSGDYELSAGFGRSGNRWSHGHSGQDFAVPNGTRVQAAHTGVVVKAGPNGAGDGPAYGNAVVIKHDDHTYTQYAHLSRIQVRVGQHVTTGDRIARSGSTGNSSGPHLHFEVRTTPDYGSGKEPLAALRHHGVHV